MSLPTRSTVLSEAPASAAPSVFGLLPGPLRALVCSRGQVRLLAPGAPLARRGERCSAVHVVVSGVLIAGERDTAGTVRPITYLWKDSLVGTHAAEADATYAYDLVAAPGGELQLFELPASVWTQLLMLESSGGLAALCSPGLRRVIFDLEQCGAARRGLLELASLFEPRSVTIEIPVTPVRVGTAEWVVVETGGVLYGERVLAPGDDVGLDLALLEVEGEPVRSAAGQDAGVRVLSADKLRRWLTVHPDSRAALTRRVALAGTRHNRWPAVVVTDVNATHDAAEGAEVIELQSHAKGSVPGWRRVPFYRQREQTDCGVSCLRMIARYHGQELDYDALLGLTQVSRYGTSLLDLARTGERLGFLTTGVQVDWQALRALQLPAIAHLSDRNHFVVVWRVTRRHVVIGDPNFATRRISREEFCQCWGGTLLLLQPTNRLAELARELVPKRKPTPLGGVYPLVRPHVRSLAELLAISMLLQLLLLALPFANQVVIDRVLTHGDTHLLSVLLFGLTVAALLSAALSYARAYVIIHTATRIERDLLETLYRRIIDGISGFFQRFSTSDVLSRFGEVALIRSFVIDNAVSLTIDLVMLTSTLAVLALYAPSLALIVMFIIPIQAGLSIVIGRAIENHTAAFLSCYDAYHLHLQDSFRGFEMIKTHVLERPFVRKAQRELAPTLEHSFRAALHGAAGASLSYGVDLLCSTAVLGAGTRLALAGSISLGTLIACTLFARQASAPVLRLATQWRDYQRTKANLVRVGSLLELPLDSDKCTSAVCELPRARGQIRFRDVTFRYRGSGSDRSTLQQVNLEIPPGEIVALVGPSGCGKSTLVRLLLRLYDPAEGTVSIDGYNLRDVTPESVRRQIGLVTQEIQLISGTIYENIACGRQVSEQQVLDAARLAGAYDFVSELPHGFQTLVGERGFSLSGGQRQRIVIARALVTDPRILIFDEATAALDPLNEQLIHERLREVVAGRTTIIISHRMQTLRHADRIIVMNAGRISQIGTHESLMTAGGKLYAALATATPDWKHAARGPHA